MYFDKHQNLSSEFFFINTKKITTFIVPHSTNSKFCIFLFFYSKLVSEVMICRSETSNVEIDVVSNTVSAQWLHCVRNVPCDVHILVK